MIFSSRSPRDVVAAMAEPESRRLRLAQVVTRMDIGGVPDHIMTLIAELRRDFDITLVCGEIDDVHRTALAQTGVPVETVPFRRLLSPLADIRTFLALFRLYKSRQFDIVHTHMSKAALIGSLAAVCARIPVVVNTAHNLGFIALPNRALRLLFWIYDFCLFRATMDAVITVSTKVRDRIVETRLFAPARVFAVHNGMALKKMSASAADAQDLRRAFGVGPDDVLIVSVARLVWFKGLSTLVSALPMLLAKAPRVHVVVAGEGQLRQELINQAEVLGVGSRFTLAGERRDIPALLAAADIFVLPSVSEGLPISIMEAMAAGKSVVATNVGGVSELVEDKETGFLVVPRDPQTLANAIAMLALDPPLRTAMGARGRYRIETDFAAPNMATQTEAIYRDCLKKNGRRS